MRLCKPPFSDYKCSGPYFHKGSGRHMMTLIPLEPGTVKQRTFPFARYLMSVKLKRELATEEHVDHRDGDRTNDVISNLQVLTPTQNSEKGVNDPLRVLRRAENMYRFKCPHCGEWPLRQEGQVHDLLLQKLCPVCLPASGTQTRDRMD
jgi:predicted RNA-binding Zn-ribbon protein involved in translation (DUF1610 family)